MSIDCYPPNGFMSETTAIDLNDDNEELLTLNFRPIQQIHLLPTYTSLNTQSHRLNNVKIDELNINDLYKSYLKPYLMQNDEAFYVENVGNNNRIKSQKRHLMEGECDMFISKGIEWKVMKCEPLDGFIDTETMIYCNGQPLHDIKAINMRPKYHSLPDIHRSYTSKQIQKRYLNPFILYGKYIEHEPHDITLCGVDFFVYSSNDNPSNGIITCSTIINSEPIKQNEMTQIHEKYDAEFAHSLQQKEVNQRNAFNHMLIEKIQQIAMNDEDDEHPVFSTFASIRLRLHDLERRQREQQRMRPPILTQYLQHRMLINALPTYQYKNNSDEEEEDISCSICLEQYINGDELKILTCFHKFHTLCIDNWLKFNMKCPICKTSIFD